MGICREKLLRGGRSGAWKTSPAKLRTAGVYASAADGDYYGLLYWATFPWASIFAWNDLQTPVSTSVHPMVSDLQSQQAGAACMVQTYGVQAVPVLELGTQPSAQWLRKRTDGFITMSMTHLSPYRRYRTRFLCSSQIPLPLTSPCCKCL